MKIEVKELFDKIFSFIKYRLFLFSLKKHDFKNKKVVLFFLHPKFDGRAGGILSVFFLLDISEKLLKDAVVLPVTLAKLPGYTKVSWFENKYEIYNIYYLRKKLASASQILVHIPEVFFLLFAERMKYCGLERLAKEMQVNILNQNQIHMPSQTAVDQNKSLFRSLSMTLAFEVNFENHYGHLDTTPYFIGSWYYNYTIDNIPYEIKDEICVISHDPHPLKKDIIRLLEEECRLKCIEIKSMRFEDFQVLQKRAKWSISFGEGFDNYFAGAFVKSGIGFSVYNKNFFPNSFYENNLPETVFASYEEMQANIVDVIKGLDEKSKYESYMHKIRKFVFDHNSPEKVEMNLKHYYLEQGLL